MNACFDSSYCAGSVHLSWNCVCLGLNKSSLSSDAKLGMVKAIVKYS